MLLSALVLDLLAEEFGWAGRRMFDGVGDQFKRSEAYCSAAVAAVAADAGYDCFGGRGGGVGRFVVCCDEIEPGVEVPVLVLRGGGGGGACFERVSLVPIPLSLGISCKLGLGRMGIGLATLFTGVLFSVSSMLSVEISGLVEERRGGSGGTGFRLAVS